MKHNGTWTPVLWKAPSYAAAQRHPFLYGMYLLAPWCNRIRNARFADGRRRLRLRPNLPDGSSMHGDVYARAWKIRNHTDTSVSATLDSREHADFNFPGKLVFRLQIRLQHDTLRVELTVRNVGARAVPVGLGFHPFFVRPVRFRLPALAQRVPTGPYPTGVQKIPDSEFWRTWQDPAKKEFDNSFCSFAPNPVAKLEIGKKRAPLALLWSTSVSDVFVYAPRRHEGRRAVFACIEPMTMHPNAFAANDSATRRTLTLKPGQRRTIAMMFSCAHAHR